MRFAAYIKMWFWNDSKSDVVLCGWERQIITTTLVVIHVLFCLIFLNNKKWNPHYKLHWNKVNYAAFETWQTLEWGILEIQKELGWTQPCLTDIYLKFRNFFTRVSHLFSRTTAVRALWAAEPIVITRSIKHMHSHTVLNSATVVTLC